MYLWLVRGYEVGRFILWQATSKQTSMPQEEWGKVFNLGEARFAFNKTDAHVVYVHEAADSAEEAIQFAKLDFERVSQ